MSKEYYGNSDRLPPWEVAIALQKIPNGTTDVSFTAFNLDVKSLNPGSIQTLWPLGGRRTTLGGFDLPETIYLTSSSAADVTTGGEDVRVKVIGIGDFGNNDSWDQGEGSFNLTGQTPLAIPVNLRRVNRLQIVEPRLPQGVIFASNGNSGWTAGVPNDLADIYSVIPLEDTTSLSNLGSSESQGVSSGCFFHVPSQYSFLLKMFHISVPAGDNVSWQARVKERDQAWRVIAEGYLHEGENTIGIDNQQRIKHRSDFELTCFKLSGGNNQKIKATVIGNLIHDPSS